MKTFNQVSKKCSWKQDGGEFIVAIYGGKQFLTGGGGDPGRTCVKESAKKYKSKWAAKCALEYAKRNYSWRDYSDSYIEEVS